MEGKKFGVPVEGLAEYGRRAAAEGAVLLRNNAETLPLKESDNVAIFGRCQFDYYRSGTGSGGAVNVLYTVNFYDGIKNSRRVHINEELATIYKKWIADNPFDNGGGGWAAEPWCQDEMVITTQLAHRMSAVSNKAIVVIGRTAGEDKDNKVEEGSYLLTSKEYDLLEKVTDAFEKVIVILNVGNVIDMSFLDTLENREHITALLYAWHGGMEGGNAITDVLIGRVPAQGKLTDTIARRIEDYPSHENFGDDIKNTYCEDIFVGYRYFETFDKDAVLFPFGYGLSYTSFSIEPGDSYTRLRNDQDEIVLECVVQNRGTKYSGREVVQIYLEGPRTKIARPAKVLVGFQKTKLLSVRENQELEIIIPFESLAVYDETGVTGYPNCYVVEKGDYTFHIGGNVRDTEVAYIDGHKHYHVDETIVIRQCEEAMAPQEAFKRLITGNKKADGTYEKEYEDVPVAKEDIAKRIADNLPVTYEITKDKGYTLQDVAADKCTMEEFIAQLSVEELAMIIRGEGMCSIKVTPGTASAFGGVSDKLLKYGIPVGCCADGPSGVRMDSGLKATQLPIGTLLACTWDPKMIEELYRMQGGEMVRNEVDTLLGPGMNIHRHPLNGRNFEYFSEDPLITGKMAAAIVRGIASNGVHATIKHFACNSQEHRRHKVDAIVSQRALREIYLKGFEIAVREGDAKSVMTSYNPINGHWAASSYDLNTTLLRKEWGFTGMVMTDWWASMNDVVDGGEESPRFTRDMVRAQNDVYMIVNNNGAELNTSNDNTLEAIENGKLTVGELQRSAMNICNFLISVPAFTRFGKDSLNIPHMRAAKRPEGVNVQNLTENNKIYLEAVKSKWFYNDKETVFGVVAKIMSPESNRAQTVCKALLNGEELNTFQTNGTDGKWIYQKLLRVKLEKGWYNLQLEVIKPGMQVAYMEFNSEE